MLGMEVPERATWARMLLAELNRVLNHLMFLGSYPIELGAITPIEATNRMNATQAAVNVTLIDELYCSLQSLPQAMPVGTLVTVPEPVPERLTVKV